MEGNWKQFKGKVKEQWARLTGGDLEIVAGKREQLLGKIQEHYGIARSEAEKQVQAFVDRYRTPNLARPWNTRRQLPELDRDRLRDYFFSPNANTWFCPRTISMPSLIAGVAISTSPTWLLANNSNCGPAFTTNTSPSSAAK